MEPMTANRQAMNSSAASILVVEDDPRQIRIYSRALRGYRLTCVSNGTNVIFTPLRSTCSAATGSA